MTSNPFEALMLICFGASWPVSIAKALRTRHVKGKSPIFMTLVFIGYLAGIAFKSQVARQTGRFDPIVFLYAFNALMVATDWCLYMRYRTRG